MSSLHWPGLEGMFHACISRAKNYITLIRDHTEHKHLEPYSYRVPQLVTDVCVYLSGLTYANCPRCQVPIERDYQVFCDRCGQALDWSRWEADK